MSTTTNTSTGTSNKEMGKKILIGTISTVLAALIIYFIVERGGGDRERKKATLQAWNSYQQNRSIFSQVMKNLGSAIEQGQQGLRQASSNAFRDIDMSIANMENIKKETNVDNRMLSLVDIDIRQFQDAKQLMNAVFTQLNTLMQANVSDQQMQQSAMSLLQQAAQQIQMMKERDKLRKDTFRKELCDEYGDDFCKD